jgi:hypothetical protein
MKHNSTDGAKVGKLYDEAETPYQRVLESGALALEQRERLQRLYRSLIPVRLLDDIQRQEKNMWATEQRSPKKEGVGKPTHEASRSFLGNIVH